MITSRQIIDINLYMLPNNSYKVNLIKSALSSYDYYEDIKDKTSSIFKGLIKNHPFSDGNKRTAAIVLFYLSDINNLQTVDDITLEDNIIKIASSNLSIEDISKLLFV